RRSTVCAWIPPRPSRTRSAFRYRSSRSDCRSTSRRCGARDPANTADFAATLRLMRVSRTSALSIAVSAALLAGGTLAVSGCGGGKAANEATPAEIEQDEEASLHREEQAEAAQQREALSVIESKQREEEAETNAETTLATAKARAKRREKAAEAAAK